MKQEKSREVPWALLVERRQAALRDGFVGVQCDLSDTQIPQQPTETPPRGSRICTSGFGVWGASNEDSRIPRSGVDASCYFSS